MINTHEQKEIWAIYEGIVNKMDAMQREHLYYLKPEWSILNAQKEIILKVIRIIF